MTVIGAYVPYATGYLAVTEGLSHARFRGTGVPAVNALDRAGHTSTTAADTLDLETMTERLDESGVPYEVRHIDAGSDQACGP